jgi:hypothetical protein
VIAGKPARFVESATALILPVLTSAHAAFGADQVHDEIQVYNAEIANVGQWIIQQHLNYAFVGQSQSEVPGGFASNHSLQGSPELAYGIPSGGKSASIRPSRSTATASSRMVQKSATSSWFRTPPSEASSTESTLNSVMKRRSFPQRPGR